jgi:hypothetical protein
LFIKNVYEPIRLFSFSGFVKGVGVKTTMHGVNQSEREIVKPGTLFTLLPRGDFSKTLAYV